MSTRMIVRIDPGLRAKAGNFAKTGGKNVSEVVREPLEAYLCPGPGHRSLCGRSLEADGYKAERPGSR